ncbi:hypothetical protein HG535_0F05700 [Zygotorulaspora mrakii]|uniref:ribonuclease Z n=1 Tax=Zygotorulaspora mrakii TaxID=42260 RepID=A0A7H9B5S3_ZYGMR|nr:uncharacterized protein HG535_0F05700 [Zygotorulaspora mrakii]QLG74058.1 hypothetical protein HG535_0F05700 [Zygotorulaspora mrakii]
MFNLTPIAHPTADTEHPLLLLQSHHGDRYFFGKVSEGSQRCLTENRIRISKLQNIFLTGELDWSTLGGLPGMILTVADQGKANLAVHYGNDLIDYVVAAWRYFVFRFGIDLKTNILRDKEVYKDDIINVKSIVISQKSPHVATNFSVFPAKEKSVLRSIISNMFPKNSPTSKYDPTSDPHLNVELPKDVEIPKISTSYEVSFHPVRGRFKAEEASKLGVPKGPLLGKLAKGETVTLEDGTQVSPEQVLEKQRSFSKVLILDIPNDSYLPHFQERFEKYATEDLGIVYYFLGEKITINDSLIKFMELFGNSTLHFVSHPRVCPNSMVFKGAAIITLKLKALQPENYNLPRTNTILSKEFYDCFEIPMEDGTTLSQSQEGPLKSKLPGDIVHVYTQKKSVKVESYTKGQEKMKIKVDDESGRGWSWQKTFNKHVKPLKISSASFENVVSSQLNIDNFNNDSKKGHVEIITLGTGSALPSKYRNVASTMIKVPFLTAASEFKNRIILFDAGENTLGTLRRMFSETARRRIFADLKMIYLSHLHADHHLGIISILKEWFRYHENNKDSYIYVVSPWQYNKFVQEWLIIDNPTILEKIRYISCEHLINSSFVRRQTIPISLDDYCSAMGSNNGKRRKLEVDANSSFRDMTKIKQMYQDMNIALFQTCKARHCNWAYSNSITFHMSHNSRKQFKVSYSGDTRPNKELFAQGIGYRSDLLIHEATLDNELMEDAIKKRHCTINEAIQVSNAMEAEKLVLTHFSQRYPKAPQVGNNISIEAKEHCFAFDGLILDYENIGEQQNTFWRFNTVFAEERKTEEEEGSKEFS